MLDYYSISFHEIHWSLTRRFGDFASTLNRLLSFDDVLSIFNELIFYPVILVLFQTDNEYVKGPGESSVQ